MAVNEVKNQKMYQDERYFRTNETLHTNKEGNTPQQQLQIEMLQQTTKGGIVGTDNNLQKQLLQMMAAATPQQQIQAVAQNQLSKGYLDIKI
jgi:hypothetical protein